jgi:transcriptional regulator with XRE-family HTH domain
MIDPRDTGDLAIDVARRLAAARRALDLDQQQFGTRAGLSQPQYNQFEKGKRLLTLAAAMKLCDAYNLTLDWLYRGDPSNLPYKLATAIRQHADQP